MFNTSALADIIRLCISRYKREEVGVIFGHYMERKNDSGIYIIESALAYPNGDRYPTYFAESDNDTNKNDRLFLPLNNYVLGDFHSHVPYWNADGWGDQFSNLISWI